MQANVTRVSCAAVSSREKGLQKGRTSQQRGPP